MYSENEIDVFISHIQANFCVMLMTAFVIMALTLHF